MSRSIKVKERRHVEHRGSTIGGGMCEHQGKGEACRGSEYRARKLVEVSRKENVGLEAL